MNQLIEKLKLGNSKKLVENSVIFLILLVILIVVINGLYTDENKVETVQTVVAVNDTKSSELEERLEKILSMIEGAGNVKVMISYSNTNTQVPLYDTKENVTVTEEKDKEGGTRKTEQTSTEQKIIFKEENNSREPVIKQRLMPEIIGVIVVADGASNVKVRENLINAVSAVADVASHRIQIFSKQK